MVHDILWQFNCALASHPVQQMAAKVKAVKEREENEQKNEKVRFERPGISFMADHVTEVTQFWFARLPVHRNDNHWEWT